MVCRQMQDGRLVAEWSQLQSVAGWRGTKGYSQVEAPPGDVTQERPRCVLVV